MALQTANAFATYGVTDGAQVRDISDVLADALYYDLHFLGAVDVDFGSPVMDVVHYWNEDALNPDTVTVTASHASTDTSIALTSGQGVRAHVGDLMYQTDVAGTTELMQITAVATDTLTVTRAYNSTTAASFASTASFALIRAEQEGSNIGADKSLTPAVLTNFTHIFSAEDIQVTGSQLARRMATVQMQDFIARQLSNRAIETKINLTRAFLYSEKSANAGNDSGPTYRSMAGIRSQINAATGITFSTAGALSYATLNSVNKSVVNNGVFPDLLVAGTDLVGSIASIDSSNRRLLESDRQAGYVVQEIVLNQGNSVRVVIDPRVKTGDCFLLSSERFHALPMNGRGMFVIAAVDFTDAKKRRVLAEWTCELRNAGKAHAYLFNQT